MVLKPRYVDTKNPSSSISARRKNTFSRRLQRNERTSTTPTSSSLGNPSSSTTPAVDGALSTAGDITSTSLSYASSYSSSTRIDGALSAPLLGAEEDLPGPRPRSPTHSRGSSVSREQDSRAHGRTSPSPHRQQRTSTSRLSSRSPAAGSPPLSSSSSASSEESVYSAYDFVNDVIQDILLNPWEGGGPSYPTAASWAPGRRRRASATPTPHWLDVSGGVGGVGVADVVSAPSSAPLLFFSPISLRRRRQRQREEEEEADERLSAEGDRKRKKRRVSSTLLTASRSSGREASGATGSTPMVGHHTRLHPAPRVRGTKWSREHGFQPLLPRPSGGVPFTLSVVLDVDETMVSARNDDGQVYLRPFLPEFIQACHAQRCEVIVWTAASALHANGIFIEIAKACRMELWYHQAITRHPRWFEESTPLSGAKDLRRLQRDLDRVVMIENNPASVLPHPQNAILVEDYTKPNEADQTFNVLKHVVQQLVAMVCPPPPTSPTATTTRSRSGSPHDSNSSRRPRRSRRPVIGGLGRSVTDALLQIPEIAKVMIGPAKKENMDAFALKYSPAEPGSRRRYGDIEST